LAIAADPVAEELYRRLMRLQADLGRPDAVRRTYQLLAATSLSWESTPTRRPSWWSPSYGVGPTGELVACRAVVRDHIMD
jgi:hypothetical protein